VTPTLVDAAGEGDVHKRTPLRPLGLLEKLHPGLVREAVPLASVAGNAGADDVFPGRLATAITGEDMIDVQTGSIEESSAVLACVLIALKHIQAGELDLFFREAIEETKDNDSRDPDPQGDGLKHSRLRIGDGKMPPAQKIMSEKIACAIRCNDLGMPLIEECQGASGGAGVDGLPQPVEDENRLIEHCIHDLAVVTDS